MKKLISLAKHPALLCFLLGNLIFALLIGLRGTGGLQPLELLAYDLGFRLKPASVPDQRILLIKQTEEDIHRFGFPISDKTFSEILKRLTEYRAKVVGVDIYRDIPVPPGTSELDDILGKNPDIVWVSKFSEISGHRIAPPKILEGTDQVGFNDIIDDPGGIVRRGLLFMDDGKNTYYSFPLMLASHYLQPLGLGLEADPDNKDFVRLGKRTVPPFQKDDGGYVDADAAGYQFLLDYKGMPGKFNTYSISELLDGKAAPSEIKNKIVVVGTEAKSLNDYFYTPHSQGLGADQRIFGIELHGFITSQLLRFFLDGDPVIRVWGENTGIFWLWVWTLLGALSGYFARTLSRFAISGTLAFALLSTVAYLGIRASWWIPFVPPSLGYLLASGIITAFMSSQEKKQRNLLMSLFSRHVSKDVAEAVWEARDDFMKGNRPCPQKLIATVLFTDLQGFTTISEKMDPETLMNWLNEYMEAMAEIVIAHQGIINKYIGDAIMAVFGVPIARNLDEEICKDAENAVDCALSMSREIIRLNSQWEAQGKATIAMRVGIYTGTLVAGSLGSSDRLEYTVIGDTVNIASRLESFDKSRNIDPHGACRILVGATTLDALRGKYDAHPVGSVALKGKEKEIEVFQITGKISG